MSKTNFSVIFILIVFSSFQVISQDVYEYKNGKEIHRLFVDANYIVETVFSTTPAKFISTRGGFYTKTEKGLHVKFEFNSDFENDGLKAADYLLDKSWEKTDSPSLELEGKWQMGGRMREEAISRRDTSNARKTMKILFKGHFQWIAYHTETMKFSGSGGGQYEIKDGKYTEKITYFSRDNSRAGAALTFDYKLIDNEWHHIGLSSKGDPFHEVWVRRD